MTSSLLDRYIRQQTSIPNPSQLPPVIINRVRTGNRFRVHRRRRPRRSRPVISSSTRSASRHNSSEINFTHRSSVITDQSRESLINLYCLFHDNLNSSKTDLV